MADPTLNATWSALLNQPVAATTQIGRGRNSQVFRVQGADGTRYAAKVYFGRRADGLSRLSVEFESLELLWSHGIRCIPQPYAADVEKGVAVYEYIDGAEIGGEEVGTSEIDELLTFLCQLKDLARTVSDTQIPVAYEASFSVEALVGNIEEKLDRLVTLGQETSTLSALQIFLRQEFTPAFDDQITRTKTALGVDQFSAELPRELRTLSPADFGFHNALRRDAGLVFLDFEYFGWEAPAKMISDFLLHPAVSLTEEIRAYCATRFLECFGDDEHLPMRLGVVYPLYGLRWCLILLNEFVPDHLERRTFASPQQRDVSQLCMEQLEKSRAMLQRTMRQRRWFSQIVGLGCARQGEVL